jgi:D-aminopeptidase
MSQSLRIRDLGYSPGVFPKGPTNSILDVDGVHVSQVTIATSSSLKPGSTAKKGVTIVSPRPPKEFYKPCRASMFCFNGNGEFTGSHQIADWGWTNTPIGITNSFSLGEVFTCIWDWVLEQSEHLPAELSSVDVYGTPVVVCSAKYRAT